MRKCGSAEVRKCGSAEVRKCGSAEVRKCGSAEVRKFMEIKKVCIRYNISVDVPLLLKHQSKILMNQ